MLPPLDKNIRRYPPPISIVVKGRNLRILPHLRILDEDRSCNTCTSQPYRINLAVRDFYNNNSLVCQSFFHLLKVRTGHFFFQVFAGERPPTFTIITDERRPQVILSAAFIVLAVLALAHRTPPVHEKVWVFGVQNPELSLHSGVRPRRPVSAVSKYDFLE